MIAISTLVTKSVFDADRATSLTMPEPDCVPGAGVILSSVLLTSTLQPNGEIAVTVYSPAISDSTLYEITADEFWSVLAVFVAGTRRRFCPGVLAIFIDCVSTFCIEKAGEISRYCPSAGGSCLVTNRPTFQPAPRPGRKPREAGMPKVPSPKPRACGNVGLLKKRANPE